jgi:hypothetical protein
MAALRRWSRSSRWPSKASSSDRRVALIMLGREGPALHSSAGEMCVRRSPGTCEQRLIEPYSLVFKRRKDGFAQEYFYAYDQSGGRSSRPGIKTFLHPKIQSLSNTNQLFEPRLPVELGKAGEFAGKTYFGGGFRTATVRARVRVRTTHVYIVECSYCGKRFPRKRYSTRLRAHKDRYGNRCYGRSGYIAY